MLMMDRTNHSDGTIKWQRLRMNHDLFPRAFIYFLLD